MLDLDRQVFWSYQRGILQVKGIKVAGSSASVSNIDFCPVTLSLAVGNECGLVRNAYHLDPFFLG